MAVDASLTAFSDCVFFFSSRRRHTRSLCDWSSDVCSSDLIAARLGDAGFGVGEVDRLQRLGDVHLARAAIEEIGRASCRERVKVSVGAESLQKKNIV